MVHVRVKSAKYQISFDILPILSKISLRSVKHGLSYDLKGNQRSDQKITDQLIMLLLCLTSLPFGVDNDRKRIFYQKHSYCKNIYLVICKNQKNTRIKDLMLKQWHS